MGIPKSKSNFLGILFSFFDSQIWIWFFISHFFLEAQEWLKFSLYLLLCIFLSNCFLGWAQLWELFFRYIIMELLPNM